MTGFALSGVSGATAAASTTSSGTSTVGGSGSSGGLTSNDFIQLLVAQLQNQNPTSPTNPQDLANEFADLATVSGINKLTSQVSSIQAGAAAAQLAQAAGLVGKQVATAGDSFTVPAGGMATGAFSLASAAQNTNVSIINPNGTLASTLTLGNQPSGINQFTWGGGSAGQTYTYQIQASSSSGAAVSATPYAVGQVSAVDLSGSAPALSVSGASAPVPLSNIVSILGG